MKSLYVIPLSLALLVASACEPPQWFHVTEGHQEARIDSVWTECHQGDASLAVRVQVDGYGPDVTYEQRAKHGATGLTLVHRSDGAWEVSFRVGIDQEAVPDGLVYDYTLRSDFDMAGPSGTDVLVRWAVLTGAYEFGGDDGFEYHEKGMTLPNC